jgi:hypothetical protein
MDPQNGKICRKGWAGFVGSFSQGLLQAIEFLIKKFWPLKKKKS